MPALLPYLRWAYVERATVCLVKVGARGAPTELQAERLVARSLLVPKISQALDEPSGLATPLAHGLDLALQFLRHALHQGRQGVRSAWIVVLTDGRGNVPLKASQTGQLDWPVPGRRRGCP